MVVMPIVMMTTDPPSGDGADAESREVTGLPFIPTTMIGGGGGGLGHGGGAGGGGGGSGLGGGEGGAQPIGRPSLSACLIMCSTIRGHSQESSPSCPQYSATRSGFRCRKHFVSGVSHSMVLPSKRPFCAKCVTRPSQLQEAMSPVGHKLSKSSV